MRTETAQAFTTCLETLGAIKAKYADAPDKDRMHADMGVQAVLRLKSLGIDTALAVDESGQTSQEDHLTWLLTATDSEIKQWAEDCRR